MKEKQLVSIIVPVYNVEKYIERCIDSILEQSYEEIEVLLLMMDQQIIVVRYVMKLRRKINELRSYIKKMVGCQMPET